MSECFWENVDQNWELFDQLWNDIIPCVLQIFAGGGIQEPQAPWDAYQQLEKKLDKKTRIKIVKVIMILKGEEITQEKEVSLGDYKVTADDIQLLAEEYKRKKSISVTVNEVTVR